MTAPRILWGLIASLVLTPACKRRGESDLADDWDAAPEVVPEETLATLSPPWTTIEREFGGNDLLTFHLVEDAAATTHVRLLIPVSGDPGSYSPADAAVVVHALRATLARRLTRQAVEVRVDLGPGRYELVLSGHRESMQFVAATMAQALSSKPSPVALDATRRELEKSAGDDAGYSYFAAYALGLDPAREVIDRKQLGERTRVQLTTAWSRVLDPSRCVLVIHGPPAKHHFGAIEQRWKNGLLSRAQNEPATARLRPNFDGPSVPRGRLLGESPAPLLRVPSHSARPRPLVIAGRALPAKTARERGLARLAQRVLQESTDARLSFVGEHAVIAFPIPVRERRAAAALQGAIDRLSFLADTLEEAPHLFQVARIWAGRRVVEASMADEDWTGLFADALDQSARDADAPTALAATAAAMLAVTPEDLRAYTRENLDPKAGAPEFLWVLSGANAALERELGETVKIIDPPATPQTRG